MLKLEQIASGQQLTGLEQDKIVRVVSVERLGEHAINAIYRDGDGRLSERMLFRSDEPAISLAESGCPWGFDASPEEFKLALEAQRIKLAYLFDPMMAVHWSFPPVFWPGVRGRTRPFSVPMPPGGLRWRKSPCRKSLNMNTPMAIQPGMYPLKNAAGIFLRISRATRTGT